VSGPEKHPPSAAGGIRFAVKSKSALTSPRRPAVIPFRQPDAVDDPLSEVAREGARGEQLRAGGAAIRHQHGILEHPGRMGGVITNNWLLRGSRRASATPEPKAQYFTDPQSRL
jgi:hypothetical protein